MTLTSAGHLKETLVKIFLSSIFTMWIFQHFYATQILREINFGHFEDPKNCRFDHLSSSEL